MNRTLLFALLAMLGLGACSTSEKDLNAFKLTLSVTNFDGKQVKLQKRTGENWTVLDSVKVEAGVAHLKGTAETPEMMFVAFEGIRGTVPFFADKGEITIKELAEKVISQTNSKSEIQYIPYKEAYGAGFEDMQRRVPNIEKIKSFTGWSPKRDLTQIISDIAESI